jgi:hypothetical protein
MQYTGICLEKLRKIRKNVSLDDRCSGRYSNWTLPEYKSEALPLEHALLAIFSLWFLSWLFIDPEDGGEIFLRNICLISTYYTELNVYHTIKLFTTISVRTSKPT